MTVNESLPIPNGRHMVPFKMPDHSENYNQLGGPEVLFLLRDFGKELLFTT